MKRHSISTLLTVVALGVPALATSPAVASYIWVAPASQCQPGKGDTGRINYSGPLLVNESTGASAKAYCSIPYEYYTFQTSTATPTFEVGYFDKNAAGTTRVSCTILVSDGFGAPVFSSTQTSQGANASVQFFDWSLTQPNLFNGFNNVSINCTLPKGPAAATRSGLTMVRVFR